MDFLESFLSEHGLSIESVRNLVDDYSLLSHYIGQELELGFRHSSPLRGDDDPSFSIFYGYGIGDKNKLYFKDQATGQYGDVYDFLKLFFNTNDIQKILQKINNDFQLGLGEYIESGLRPVIQKSTPIIKERAKLGATCQNPTEEFMNYWYGKYEITKTFTDLYYAKCVKVIHLKYQDSTKVVLPKTLCIGYYIGKYLKFYQPFEDKSNKFRNDYPSNYVEGHIQIDWSRNDLLVITKSMKECILFRCHWNIQAVAGKSETTMIPHNLMLMYLNHFKRVVIWLDPDPAGITFTEKYAALYPKLEVALIPGFVKEKDPTDIFEINRKVETTKIIKNVLNL